jgi:acyl-CoA reductase-like NAD-dependent aldehyde dehydrogenase
MAEPFMDGGYVEFSGLDRMTIVDPANGEEVGTVPAGGVAEVNQAVRSAHEAFLAWRDTPAAKRGEILGKAAHAVLSATEELAPVLTSEQGKPLREARLEIRRFVHTLEHYVGLAKMRARSGRASVQARCSRSTTKFPSLMRRKPVRVWSPLDWPSKVATPGYRGAE